MYIQMPRPIGKRHPRPQADLTEPAQTDLGDPSARFKSTPDLNTRIDDDRAVGQFLGRKPQGYRLIDHRPHERCRKRIHAWKIL
jgi:hypothetical protein